MLVALGIQPAQSVGHERVARVELKSQVKLLPDAQFDLLEAAMGEEIGGRDRPERAVFG